MTNISPAAVRQQVLLRLDALRALSYARLAELPAWRTEAVLFGVNVAHVATYSELLADGTLEIVVQCMPQGDANCWTREGDLVARFGTPFTFIAADGREWRVDPPRTREQSRHSWTLPVRMSLRSACDAMGESRSRSPTGR